MRLARWLAPAMSGVVVLGSIMVGVSVGADAGPSRAATASHPNLALRALSPAQRAAISPHLLYAHPGTTVGARRAPAARRRSTAQCPWLNDSLSVGARVSMLLSQMTLADKLDLMEGHNGDASNGAIGDTHAIPSLCVPQVTQEDGPAGVADGVSGATQLPAPVNDAATWDRSQARRYGAILGNEEWAKGNEVVYAPTINIDRDPRWGRNFESLSEDPLLTGTLGSAEIQGIQSQGPIAQVKHYAVYNVETNRNTPLDNDIIDQRTLHEIYLPAFYDAVTRGKAGSVMCSYSSPERGVRLPEPAAALDPRAALGVQGVRRLRLRRGALDGRLRERGPRPGAGLQLLRAGAARRRAERPGQHGDDRRGGHADPHRDVPLQPVR